MLKLKSIELIRCLFWLIGLICLLILLYLRFKESITRAYSIDEYAHLHMTYLLASGKIPHRDFFTPYSSLFHLTLLPIFKVLGESYTVLILSRIVIFFYFLLTLACTYGIGKAVAGRYIAFLAVMIAAALPISIEKTIEIRPDNLMILLCLAGIYFFFQGMEKSNKGSFIASGVLFALSILVMAKTIFAIAAFILSVVIWAFVDRKVRDILRKGSLSLPLAACFVIFVYLVILAAFGILKEAYLSIFVYAQEIVAAFRFGNELHPFYWFGPIDAVYGTYKGLPWYTNNLIFIFLLIGIGISLVKFLKERRITKRLLLFLPMGASFFYLFMSLRPYQQYLLPFFAFVPFFSAFGIESVCSFLKRKSASFFYLASVAFFLLLVLSMWSSWQVKKWWDDVNDKKFITYVLTRTKPTDVFWGDYGRYIFRQDGHFVYFNTLFEFPTHLAKKFPPFVEQIEARKTKYLLFSFSALRQYVWPFDSRETAKIADWIMANFEESDFPNLWVRKEKL